MQPHTEPGENPAGPRPARNAISPEYPCGTPLEAAALVAQLADPDRGWDAIVIGEFLGPCYVSVLTYCTTMTLCPSGLSVTVYQMVRPSGGRWRR